MPHNHSQRSSTGGFTLIETVMVIVLAGAFAWGSAQFILAVTDTWQFISFRGEIGAQARIGMERMIREIRSVRDADSIATADSDDFDFTDANDISIQFQYSGSVLTRDSDELAEGISAFTFRYYDESNNALSMPVVDTTQIRRVQIDITASQGTQSMQLVSDVFLRNAE